MAPTRTGLRLLALTLLPLVAQAQTTYYVNGSCGNDGWTGTNPACVYPDGPKRTIQAGIDASVTGDMVIVADGTYTGDGNRDMEFGDREITLRSQNGPGNCIIDCQGSRAEPHRALILPRGLLEGLTIKNGYSDYYGGGGAADIRSPAIVRNCVFINNRYAHISGGAISASRGPVTIENCAFVFNDAWQGGAISFETGTHKISNCTFVGNTTGSWGGAVAVRSSHGGLTEISNCIFVGNDAGNGGAVWFGVGPAAIRNSTFVSNWARSDYGDFSAAGAIYVRGDNGAAGSITNCILAQNYAWDSYYGKWKVGHIWGPNGYVPAPINYCDVTHEYWPGVGNTAADPQFANGPTGTWTQNAMFVAATYATTFYDDTASYGDLSGKFIEPDTNFVPNHTNFLSQSLIVGNTATTIVVWGNMADLGRIGNSYQIQGPHLTETSPCIDTGDPAFVPMPGETDMDGEMRVWDGDGDGNARVDMGADEYGSYVYGDLNCDGAINAGDIDPFFLALGDPVGYATQFPDCNYMLGDMNGDGAMNGADIDPFFECLGGACP